jgi:transposase
MSEQVSRKQESSSQPAALEKAETRSGPKVPFAGGQAHEAPAAVLAGVAGGQPRFHCADRDITVPARKLDQIIEPDHPARCVWQFTEGLDLSALYDRIRAREHTRGRSPIDPRILVTLWLYAILYGVISARRLAELCEHHNAFQWLAGGVSVNHHTLSDFLVDEVAFVEQLLKHSLDVLAKEGLVDLQRVGQDGMRVRASAGAASFHRQATLERIIQDAQSKLQKLQQQTQAKLQPLPTPPDDATERVTEQEVPAEENPPTSQGGKATVAQQAAQKRAAEEAIARAKQALARLPEMEAKKDAKDRHEARVSSTDPEATVMKMADGGFRPAYNFQYSTTSGNKIIVGVEVVTVGSDQGQLPPMLDQVENRCGERPKEAMVDGGFVNLANIDTVQTPKGEKGACKVYAPVSKPKKEDVDRYAPHPGDSKKVAEWRQRMGTDEAKEIYKERAATAELVNAQARNRGLIRLLVRGLQKVKAIALWFAVVHNMARGFALLSAPSGPV